MKKKKQTLTPIAIESFHTSLSENDKRTIDGGTLVTTTQNPRPASPAGTPAMTIDFWNKSIPPGACPIRHKGLTDFTPAINRPCGASACMSEPGDILATCTLPSNVVPMLPKQDPGPPLIEPQGPSFGWVCSLLIDCG